jgi:diguanylate cyclase (GGDEF)-like protein
VTFHRLEGNGGAQDLAPVPNETRSGVVSMDRWKAPARETVNEMLSSALLAGNSELRGILQQIEAICQSFKPDVPERQAVDDALQATAWYALRQTILEGELRSLALTDDLTGLYNRRGFLAVATQQLKLARRNDKNFLVFFADLDNLKQINDSHGHMQGDLALIRAARALEQTFRDSDIVARLGGDEFAALALVASSRDQESILRRLERNLNRAGAKESRYELSLSVGVARFDPARPASLGELIARADQAMYEEKRRRSKLWTNQIINRTES